MYEMMGSKFDFSDVVHTPPTELFAGELKLSVGAKEVLLVELGPAHTRGDSLAYVPADRTVFTGDLMFVGGHPILWAGPMQNWIKACDKILSWDVETVVPGHGPITDKSGVRAHEALSGIHLCGGAQALRRRHDVRAGRARHQLGGVPRLGRLRAAAGQCRRPATASSPTTRPSATSSTCSP